MTEPNSEPWSIKRVLAWATDDFKRRGNKSARLDAELLLGEALGLDRIKLIVEAERPLADDELSRYRDLIKRRRAFEPIAYILGRREFFALPMRVDRRVLIPRPDTEILVETALSGTRDQHLYGRMLDLCTGSGCVAIAFAKERPTWRVTAVDLSPDAVAVARENAQRAGVVHNLAVLEGDLFAALPEGARFELITANPPYIPSAEIATLDPDVRDFEPRLALDGGSDGLSVTRRLVTAARRYLTPGGLLALEGGFDQAPAVTQLLDQAGFCQIARSRDLAGVERVVSGRAP
ncbi:MAG TPA: peptide chain release factor N(5)-glutamine methyltransferase [Polyangiaceae bacterium]|nr:peptide chain release factor N(5)-glutamine methyltransferase [Polyangiaceae bacterium]